jgi:hypothetical protein
MTRDKTRSQSELFRRCGTGFKSAAGLEVCSYIHKLWYIPERVARIWITVSDQPLCKQSIRLSVKSDNPHSQRLDGRNRTSEAYVSIWQRRRMREALGLPDNAPLKCYLTVEYKVPS